MLWKDKGNVWHHLKPGLKQMVPDVKYFCNFIYNLRGLSQKSTFYYRYFSYPLFVFTITNLFWDVAHFAMLFLIILNAIPSFHYCIFLYFFNLEISLRIFCVTSHQCKWKMLNYNLSVSLLHRVTFMAAVRLSLWLSPTSSFFWVSFHQRVFVCIFNVWTYIETRCCKKSSTI